MAFAVATASGASGGGAAILCGNTTAATPYTPVSHLALQSSSSSSSSRTRRSLHLVSAKKLSRRSDLNIPETTATTTTTDQEPPRIVEIDGGGADNDGYPPRPLPGSERDFFEGPQWDTVGLIGEYLWIAGVVFAILAGLYGATNYNQGAADFKDTPAYKESVQSRELLEQPDASDSDVFESNPTEVAPSLE